MFNLNFYGVGNVSGAIGRRRVVRVINVGRRNVGFMFSNCHFIFTLLDVGSSVIEVE